jgi:hypothetical protein
VSGWWREPEVTVMTVEQDEAADEERRYWWGVGLVYAFLVISLFILYGCSRGDVRVSPVEPEPAASSVIVTTTTPPAPVPQATGRLTVNGQPVFPLSEYAGPRGDLSDFAGGEAVADRVWVESVPADEGFWLGADTTNRVWVQLVNVASESPYKVEPGAIVSFVGRVVETPRDFPQEVGVTPEEGARQMRDQRQHIQVEGIALKLYD